MKIKNKFSKILIVLLVATLNLAFVNAVADFEVTSFSCTPSDVVISQDFSCNAQVKNTGDAAGAVNTATLYSDVNNWLENSNYPQSSGVSVNPGQTTEVTFTGLRAVKSGNNGFSKIMLDDVTDTYVADSNKEVMVINVILTVSDNSSSARMGESFISTATVVAGGNIDVLLTFSVDSGGCNIGSQSSQKTITAMKDKDTQSRNWIVTQGISGHCRYTISATATGSGVVISSTPSIVTCSNCPSDSSPGTTTTGGGGGGGGGEAGRILNIGELISSATKEIAKNEKIKFNISGKSHYLTLINLTDISAKITIESEKQTFTLLIGDEIKVDLNSDGNADISVKLKSINILTKKANLVLTRISGEAPTASEEVAGTGKAVSEEERGAEAELTPQKVSMLKYIIIGTLILVIIVIVIMLLNYIIKNRKERREMNAWL